MGARTRSFTLHVGGDAEITSPAGGLRGRSSVRSWALPRAMPQPALRVHPAVPPTAGGLVSPCRGGPARWAPRVPRRLSMVRIRWRPRHVVDRAAEGPQLRHPGGQVRERPPRTRNRVRRRRGRPARRACGSAAVPRTATAAWGWTAGGARCRPSGPAADLPICHQQCWRGSL